MIPWSEIQGIAVAPPQLPQRTPLATGSCVIPALYGVAHVDDEVRVKRIHILPHLFIDLLVRISGAITQDGKAKIVLWPIGSGNAVHSNEVKQDHAQNAPSP